MPDEHSVIDSIPNGKLGDSETAYIIGAFEIANAIRVHGMHNVQAVRIIDRQLQSMERHARSMEREGTTPEGLLKRLVPDYEIEPPVVSSNGTTGAGNSNGNGSHAPAEIVVSRDAYIPLAELVHKMRVPVKHRANAIKAVRELIAAENPEVSPYTIKVTRGYQITPSPNVIEHITPVLIEKGLMKRIVEASEITTEPHTPKVRESYEGFVSLTRLMEDMHVPVKNRATAVQTATQMLDADGASLKGNYVTRGKGYSVNPTDEVRGFFMAKFEKDGLLVRGSPGRKSKKIVPATAIYESPKPRTYDRIPEITLGLKSTERMSEESCDFEIGGAPIRLSGAALEGLRKGTGMKIMGSYAAGNMQENLKSMLIKGVKSSTTKYIGRGHEIISYTDAAEGLNVDFRVTHGTVTDISPRRKL